MGLSCGLEIRNSEDHSCLEIEEEERVFLSEMVVTEELGEAKATRLVYGDHLIKEFSEEDLRMLRQMDAVPARVVYW